ncbi:MAG: hypothetical protein JNM17_23315 [Archangium sp.]|nr:hypothetical protein [Archangium sp.]
MATTPSENVAKIRRLTEGLAEATDAETIGGSVFRQIMGDIEAAAELVDHLEAGDEKSFELHIAMLKERLLRIASAVLLANATAGQAQPKT